jgi:hypothetical protein
MKFVAMRPCEFYVDQLFNLHGNDEIYGQMFVPIVARALQRARFPDAAEQSRAAWYAAWKALARALQRQRFPEAAEQPWVAWYAAWKALTPTVGLAVGPCGTVLPKRTDVDIRDWGMAFFFYDTASDWRGRLGGRSGRWRCCGGVR